MFPKSVSGTCLFLALVACPALVGAATVCVDRDEFAGLIQRVELTHKELANVKAQVSLYQKANLERREVIRLSDEYIQALEQFSENVGELNALYEQREQTAANELDRVTWWRNVGWGTAVAVAIGVIVIGVLK